MLRTSHHRAARELVAAALLPALALACALFAPPAAAAPSANDIDVVRAGGRVTVTASGVERAAKAGTILPLPSALQTGRDGSADLRQGPTTIGVGPDTRLDFPAPTERDAFDRVVQPGGQAFYDVGPRGSRKLRIETPYLVAVIKGTQFNVVVSDDSTTISLFEGSLELHATDGGATVQLNAGEIAIRRKGEDVIRVVRMRDVAATGGATKLEVDGDLKGDGTLATPALPIDPIEGKVTVGVEGDVASPTGTDAEVDADVNVGGTAVDADAGIEVGPGGTVDAGADADADLDTGLIDAGVDSSLDAALDPTAGTVDSSLDLGADLGTVDTSAGLDAGVDLTGSDAGVDLGAELLGTEVDSGLDLGGEPTETETAPTTQESGGLLGTLGGLLGGTGL